MELRSEGGEEAYEFAVQLKLEVEPGELLASPDNFGAVVRSRRIPLSLMDQPIGKRPRACNSRAGFHRVSISVAAHQATHTLAI
jgi:hypothetical protein